MRCLKYRTKWSFGCALKWEHIFIDDKDEEEDDDCILEEVIESIHDKHNHSDKYRGVDYEIIDPPREVLMEEIRLSVKSAEYRIKHIIKLSDLLISIQG